jgi:hypothetical protein
MEIKQVRYRESAGHTASTGRLVLVMTMRATSVVKTGISDAPKLLNSAGVSMDVDDVIHWSWGGQKPVLPPEGAEQRQGHGPVQSPGQGRPRHQARQGGGPREDLPAVRGLRGRREGPPAAAHV